MLHMKKIDKLVLDAIIGPFLITFLVVVFILLNVNMLKYFDDIIGKGLDYWTLGQLFFHFAVLSERKVFFKGGLQKKS